MAGEWWLEGGEERDVAVEIGCAGQGQGRRADSEQRGPPRHKRRDARPSDGGSITKKSGFIAPAAAELESKAYELAPARAAELGECTLFSFASSCNKAAPVAQPPALEGPTFGAEDHGQAAR